MAQYEYSCKNEECENYMEVKSINIPMSEYSEEKLPVCQSCNGKVTRVYNAPGCKTFSDGYKG